MAELQELRSSLRPLAPAGALETMRKRLERCFPLSGRAANING